MLQAIGEQGHQVDLLTYHIGKDICLENVRIHRIPRIPFVRRVPIGPSFVKLPLDCLLLLKALKMVSSCRYDCIHAVEESVFIAFLLRRLFHIPYIYDMDSCISDQLAYTGKLRNRHMLKLIRLLESVVIRNSAVVLTVCSALTEFAIRTAPGKKGSRKLQLAQAKACDYRNDVFAEYLPCGTKVFQIEDCPVEIPGGKKAVSRQELGVGEDSVIVMYAGNFESYQGVEMLLESVSVVLGDENPVKLVLVGGEQMQVQRLKLLAGQLGIPNSVLFYGKRPVEEIPSLLAAADILVSPRLKGTNTPLKIFDYLASGKPVVATRLPMHTQVLSDKVARLAEADVQHFSQAISNLVRDRTLRHKIGEEGKKLVESRYSASIFKKKVKEVYEFVGKAVVK